MEAHEGAGRASARRRRLIVVCGLGGTGKTVLADALSRELDVACLHKDVIKAALHDAGIVTARSFQIFRTLVEERLADGIDLIVEATFHERANAELLDRWREAFDLDVVCVVCHADRDERRRRIETRDRHPAHADADRQQLLDLDRAADWSRLPGRRIDVTTQEEPAETLRSVLERLEALPPG